MDFVFIFYLRGTGGIGWFFYSFILAGNLGGFWGKCLLVRGDSQLIPRNTYRTLCVVPCMREECEKFQGLPERYQEEAAGRYVYVWQSPLGAYAYLNSTCGTRYCLNVDHLQVTRPKALDYPRGVCTYCGLTGSTKDHLEPVTWTGEASRRYVVTVPACGECNSMIGDSFAPTVARRRAIAHAGIRKKYKRVINRREFTPEELDEFEGGLRASVVEGMAERQYLLDRLAWPVDPAYDLRALELSEIDARSRLELLGNSGT